MLDDARHAVAEARTDLADAIASQSEATASLSGSPGTPTQDLPEYRAAAAMLAKARLDLDHAEVRAPVDGIVGLHDLQVGEYINVGQTAMPLVATSPIWVEANFKETELEKMKVGDVTEPLRVKNGYQLLKLDTRSPAEVETFEKSKDLITNKVLGARVDVEKNKFLEKLLAQAVIEWKDDNYKKMYETARAAARSRAKSGTGAPGK